jgi:hypothetical protein
MQAKSGLHAQTPRIDGESRRQSSRYQCPIRFAPKMETAWSPETSVSCHITARRHTSSCRWMKHCRPKRRCPATSLTASQPGRLRHESPSVFKAMLTHSAVSVQWSSYLINLVSLFVADKSPFRCAGGCSLAVGPWSLMQTASRQYEGMKTKSETKKDLILYLFFILCTVVPHLAIPSD